VPDAAATDAAVTVVAVVGSVWVPAVKVVEVPSRFHPLELPVASLG